ncbi:MAG: flagellar basal body P-ring formation protein FlgA [Phycisphaerales bacterium]|nr:flagellar basal body P-ring formation protein FlgA [Phycisphaerales bacterium]
MNFALSILASSLLTASALADGTIALRSTARLNPSEPLTLSAIADLSGPDAIRWATLNLGDKDADTITLDNIREALQQHPDIHWGKLTLRGSSCTIIRTTPPAPRPVSLSVEPAATPSGPTLRSLVQSRIIDMLSASPADVRITFAQQNNELLDTPTTGRIAEIQPMGRSDRLTLSIRLFEADRIIADASIRADVQVRRQAMFAKEQISRGEPITDSNIALESRWLSMTDEPAPASDVLSSEARGRIRAGQLITIHDIQAPVVVKKGDLVNVDCLAGAIALRRTMRATEQARDHEVITLEALTGKATTRARMNGPGRAVMIVDQAHELANQPADQISAAQRPASPHFPPGRVAEAPRGGDGSASTPSPTLMNPTLPTAAQAPVHTDPSTAQVGSIRIQKRTPSNEGKRLSRFTKLADQRLDTDTNENKK